MVVSSVLVTDGAALLAFLGIDLDVVVFFGTFGNALHGLEGGVVSVDIAALDAFLSTNSEVGAFWAAV